jgi:hypothetical protein
MKEKEPDRDDAARELAEALKCCRPFKDVQWNEANAIFFTRREDGLRYRVLVEGGYALTRTEP